MGFSPHRCNSSHNFKTNLICQNAIGAGYLAALNRMGNKLASSTFLPIGTVVSKSNVHNALVRIGLSSHGHFSVLKIYFVYECRVHSKRKKSVYVSDLQYVSCNLDYV